MTAAIVGDPMPDIYTIIGANKLTATLPPVTVAFETPIEMTDICGTLTTTVSPTDVANLGLGYILTDSQTLEVTSNPPSVETTIELQRTIVLDQYPSQTRVDDFNVHFLTLETSLVDSITYETSQGKQEVAYEESRILPVEVAEALQLETEVGFYLVKADGSLGESPDWLSYDPSTGNIVLDAAERTTGGIYEVALITKVT